MNILGFKIGMNKMNLKLRIFLLAIIASSVSAKPVEEHTFLAPVTGNLSELGPLNVAMDKYTPVAIINLSESASFRYFYLENVVIKEYLVELRGLVQIGQPLFRYEVLSEQS